MMDIPSHECDLFFVKFKSDNSNRAQRMGAEPIKKCLDFVESMTGIRPHGQGAYRMMIDNQMHDIWISPYVENEQDDE